ncbi:hypothetical protein [Mycobacterium sp. ACS4331]|uniref:hypothetical protein n=1 Tax=Mycobacterium sp. ACS4331 TaxID=1834121 RepID=UPI0007FBEC77|nr:hypothetical protein [Mycobacterium sp. ACS4331]OBF29128.1 hypothetical protein A5727_24075 [Mycobacterium sp. ACS4331]
MSTDPRGGYTGAREHENIHLLPGETRLMGADFTASPLLRHIKTGLVITHDRVVARYPQYMFFIIKVGYAESSIPIQQVCEVTTGRLLSRRRVRMALFSALGALFVLMSTASLGGPFGIIGFLIALVLLAFAALLAWLARGLALTVGHSGSGEIRVDVDGLEFDAMLQAGRLIQQLVLDRDAATPVRQTPPVVHTPSPAPAVSQAFAPAPSVVEAPPAWSRPTVPAPTPVPPQPQAAQSSPPPPSIWRG